MCVKKKIVQQDRVFIGAVYWGIPCTFYGGHSVGKFTAVQDLTVGFYAFRLICYSDLSQDGLTLLKVKKLILNLECILLIYGTDIVVDLSLSGHLLDAP